MTDWKKLICPSCQEFVGVVYVWGKFQLQCPHCGYAIQVRTRLKINEEVRDVDGEDS